jgi:hypothetical protein
MIGWREDELIMVEKKKEKRETYGPFGTKRNGYFACGFRVGMGDTNFS